MIGRRRSEGIACRTGRRARIHARRVVEGSCKGGLASIGARTEVFVRLVQVGIGIDSFAIDAGSACTASNGRGVMMRIRIGRR